VASTPESRPRDYPRPSTPAYILDEIRVKKNLRRQWQITRDPALEPDVNRLQRAVTYRLNKCCKEQWSCTLYSLDPEDQSLWELGGRVMRIPLPLPPLVTLGGTSLCNSEKAEAMANNLLSQFQPVNDQSYPAVIEMVTEALQAYSGAPGSKPKLTKPMEVPGCYSGCQGPQSFRPQLLTEQGSEAPSAAVYKPPRNDIHSNASSAVLPTNMETRPRDFHPVTREGPVTTVVLWA
jgi:hypothetical protein